MSDAPLVSIIIPVRNEEKFIAACLDSIIANDYPQDKMEVLIIDGRSEDKTGEIIQGYCQRYSFIELIDNPQKITPTALNIGIKKAQGEIIVRMDGHSTYDEKYISNCVKYLNEYRADNVGGIWRIKPREETVQAKSIALALASFFGAGNAYYRTGYDKSVKWVDTVFGGCFRREIFQKNGLFNEKLTRSQDMEFNIRLRKAGGKILLVPAIISDYYPEATIRDFVKKNFKDGLWATYPFKYVKMPLRPRHYAPLFFVVGLVSLAVAAFFNLLFFYFLVFTLAVYLAISLWLAAKAAIKEKEIAYLLYLPLAFACRHFIYGFGSGWGIIKIIFNQ